MLARILILCLLVATTVIVHTAGIAVLSMATKKWQNRQHKNFWIFTRMLIFMTWSLILLHAIEIAIWGTFYHVQGIFQNAEEAFYFSGVTYTTVGYGDLVLASPWRLFAPTEALTGIIMCGISTAFFFSVVSNFYLSLKKSVTK